MITSIQNSKIQLVRALLSKSRHRYENQVYVLEGIRLAEEALASGCPAEMILFTPELSNRGKEVVQAFSKKGTLVEEIAPKIMDSLSETENSQGLLLVTPIQIKTLPPHLDFLVIADTIRDPGNLGAILRSSAAAGVEGVLLTPGTVDVYSPKVLRSAVGAHFRLPVVSLEWPEIHSLLKERSAPLEILLAEARQGDACWEANLRQPVALLIGGEAEGPSSPARLLADRSIHIPMPGGFESLNAAVAAAIILFEVVRQRSIKP